MNVGVQILTKGYLGLDFVEGKGVDIILSDAYKIPLEDGSADVVTSELAGLMKDLVCSFSCAVSMRKRGVSQRLIKKWT